MDAVKALDYPKEDYEVIVVDNGSTDRTFRMANNYDIRVIGSRKHLRNSESMNVGAKNSIHDNLLFIDQRTVVKKDILKNIKEINYSPVIAGELNIDKYRSGHDTFMFLINSKMYSPHFPQSKYAKELWITKKNLGNVHKNKAMLFIDKFFFNKLFEIGFDFNDGNDDLFRKIVLDQNQRILSHTDINVEFISDLKVKTNRDIVENGYKWAEKHLTKFNVFSFLYYMIHTMIITIIVIYPNISIGVLFALYIVFLIYLSENKKDFWILVRAAPGEILRFYSGTIKYFTSKS